MANLTLQRAYERDLARELVRQPPHPSPALARKELTTLPNAVREYVLASGSLDRAHASNARIVWREMLLQNSEGAQTLRVDCEQVNFLREPSRMALMRSALAGVIPFSGYDRYRNGRGEMLIRLGGICPLRHARGPHMDASGLATFLSEALLLPLLFVHPSLQWSALDERSARATIHHAGTFVSGVFSFDAANEWARFETCDRWRDGRPPVRQRWSAEVTDFAWHKGLRIPGRARAFWHADARTRSPRCLPRSPDRPSATSSSCAKNSRARCTPRWATTTCTSPRTPRGETPCIVCRSSQAS